MQTPTLGTALLYQPQHPDTAPHREIPLDVAVTYVHADRLVDIEGAESDGTHFFETHVLLLQEDDDAPVSGRFAYWAGAAHQASPVRDADKAPEQSQDAVQAAESAIDHDQIAETAANAATVRAEHAEASERSELPQEDPAA